MELWFVIQLMLAAGLGMAFGSYATMPYYRLPNGEPCAGRWLGKRSHCVRCDVKLRTRDLVPVFNWIWTRGKCFNCGVKVNRVYFFIEAGCMLASILLFLRFGFSQEFMLLFGLAVCLIILNATDYSYRMYPDAVLIVIVMLGLMYRTLVDGEIWGMVHSFTLALLTSLALADWLKSRGWLKEYNFEAVKSSKLKVRSSKRDEFRWDYLKLLAISGIFLSIPQWVVFVLAVVTSILTFLIIRISSLSLRERARVRERVSKNNPHPDPLPDGEGEFRRWWAAGLGFSVFLILLLSW